MPERRRAVRKFTDRGHTTHNSFEAFLENPFTEGLNSIKSNNRWFDFMYEDRGSKVTLVTFSAAASARTETYPGFSGHRVADSLGANWLGFSDPAMGSAESLPTFWHLGTRRVDSRRFVPAVLRKFQDLDPEQSLLFFGSSAGGFAALNYGSQFPGSVAFVMNPRIDILAMPHKFDRYSRTIFGDHDPARIARTLPTNMAERYSSPVGNAVYYVQNLQDDVYVEHHYLPFVEATAGRSDVEFITGNWGEGHVVPPKGAYMGQLQSLAATAPNWGARQAEGLTSYTG